MNKLYTVASIAPIVGLSDIMGPLRTPTKMEFHDVLTMVKRGYVIFEHNPVDPIEKVRVDQDNINSITFKNTRASALERHALNKAMIEDATPVYVEPIVKEKKKEEKRESKKEEKLEIEDTKDPTKKAEKVSSPDDFTNNTK